MDKKQEIKCEHKETYVAVRHESGLKIVKCRKCGCRV